MAYPSSIFLLAVLFVALAPSANGQLIINGLPISNIDIIGRLLCTTRGNIDSSCPACPGIPGVNVVAKLSTGLTLAQNSTDGTGSFQIYFGVVNGLIFDPLTPTIPVVVQVQLPIDNCTVLPPTGILQAAVFLLNVVVTELGNIAVFADKPFQLMV